MKFMGLIVMCAASCIALLLPAAGVVKFPVLDQATLQSLSVPNADQNGGTATHAQATDPQASAGLLVAAQVSAQDNAAAGQPNSASLPGARKLLGKIPFTQVPSQRVGLGVWLLLLPAMLIGLGMWTFGSSPKASK